MSIINVFDVSTLLSIVLQMILDVCSAHPVAVPDGAVNFNSKKFERSLQPVCPRKKLLKETDGIIALHPGYRYRARNVSCSWVIHVPHGQVAQLEFTKLNIEDSCPGICECNYLALKEHIRGIHPVIHKYCNRKKPPRILIFEGDKLRIHLSIKSGIYQRRTTFEVKYKTSGNRTNVAFQQKTEKLSHKTYYHGKGASYLRIRKLVPSDPVNDVTRTTQPVTKDPGPSKLTILLAVAVPIVLIFLLVVVLIAYYNHWADMKAKESGEDIPKNGTTISDIILNTSMTLTPMFNLGKAKRESSQRKEKANKLYDDMLQNWRQMNATKRQREKAKEDSVNTWESYKKFKQRRNTRDASDSDSQAFAMLVNNAINVVTTPHENEAKPEETTVEIEERPKTNSILVKRTSSDRNSRGSRVLSWSDHSTTPPKHEDESSKKRTKSETELKTTKTKSVGSTHIPAIVVSQPSIETEDDESETNDTDKLLGEESENTKSDKGESKSAETTYSCSEHVKDILRESYGEELEDWFQKPKKTASHGSLQQISDSNVKYQAMKTTEDAQYDDDID